MAIRLKASGAAEVWPRNSPQICTMCLLFNSEIEVVDPKTLPKIEVGKAVRVVDGRKK